VEKLKKCEADAGKLNDATVSFLDTSLNITNVANITGLATEEIENKLMSDWTSLTLEEQEKRKADIKKVLEAKCVGLQSMADCYKDCCDQGKNVTAGFHEVIIDINVQAATKFQTSVTCTFKNPCA